MIDIHRRNHCGERLDMGNEGMLIGFLEVIKRVVVPPILRTGRGVYREEKNDFHLGKNLF